VRVWSRASFPRVLLAARAQRGLGAAQRDERSITVTSLQIHPRSPKVVDVFAATGFFCPGRGYADGKTERHQNRR